MQFTCISQCCVSVFENFEIIEGIISTIQNEIILFCVLVWIKDSFDISNFIKYFEDYGMEPESSSQSSD